MSAHIDNRAIVSPKAQIGSHVTIGPNSIIEDDVIIGDGTTIGTNALLANGTRIGKECQIHHGAVLGTKPQDLKYRNEATTLEIGDHTVVREYATLNRGTHEQKKTTIGAHCFIMAYVHVAHDCIIGNHVILANAVNMAGHVVVEDSAVVGGLVPIHQFVRIGRHAMVGGGYRVSKDVPPYVLAGHEPLVYQGLNVVGLKRRNFSQETLDTLEKAYNYIYNSQWNVTQAIEKIRKELPPTEELKHVVEFIEMSKRGIIWKRR
ncbi:MAG TPA: acyl-ACP--UDP-N-acetylglucosamine O-acyltransferase [Bacteroidota bacterium]|nr:acyl-ACP--UDP-N-acetylglucosamine O-acyltransferase [Bacteroidota bacterium]